MKRVIITGSTGAIGMALIEYLNRKNIQVIAMVREDSKRKRQINESGNFVVVECSLDRLRELPIKIHAAIERKQWDRNQRIDVFYHLAWDGTFGDSRNDVHLQNRNVTYVLEAVNAAVKMGCKTFIGVGSQAEYGRFEGKLNSKVSTFPDNGYGIAKLCAGQLSRIQCSQLGIRHIWVRILSIYGRYDGEETMIMSSIRSMLNGESPEYTPAGQIWDYLYSKDAADALYLAAERGRDGAIYCLGSGCARPLKEYIEIIRDEINPEIPLKIGAKPYADKQVMYLCADITDLQNDTGFVPKYSFEEGIKETIKWARQRQINKWVYK